MEKPSKNRICPLLGFPPFASLPFLYVFRVSLLRQSQIDNSEKKLTPWHQALVTLLVFAEVNNDRRPVCFQNKMQHRRNLLRRTNGLPKHLHCDIHKCREKPLNEFRKDIVLLSKSERSNCLKGSYTPCMKLTQRILVSSFLISSGRPGHLF